MNVVANVAALEKCGARTRSGEPCRNARMRGRRRCRMHGGRSLRGFAHPSIRHGLYSGDLLTRYAGAHSVLRLGRCLDGTPVREVDGRFLRVEDDVGTEAGVTDAVAQRHAPEVA